MAQASLPVPRAPVSTVAHYWGSGGRPGGAGVSACAADAVHRFPHYWGSGGPFIGSPIIGGQGAGPVGRPSAPVALNACSVFPSSGIAAAVMRVELISSHFLGKIAQASCRLTGVNRAKIAENLLRMGVERHRRFV